MSKQAQVKKVFVDTMVFLHYVPLEEMDLPALIGANRACVVVPRITLHELDVHKNAHSSSRIRDRARRALLRVEKWTSGEAKIRDNVTAERYLPFPNIDFAQHGLNPGWGDDVLIASVLCYKNAHPEEDVVLLTQDCGSRLAAQTLGIEAVQPPDRYLLPPEPDPLEVENRKLSADLERIRNALPEPIVYFAGDGERRDFARFVLPVPSKLSESEIREKVNELRTRLPKRHPTPAQLGQSSTSGETMLRQYAAIAEFYEIPPEEYDRYNRDLEDYFSKSEEYMRKASDLGVLGCRTLRFRIEIGNTGTAPAEDVDVELHFPDGFRLLPKDRLPSPPAKPQPPRLPMSRTQQLTATMGDFQIPGLLRLGSSVLQVTKPPSFRIRHTKSYTISDHFERIKHGLHVQLPELHLTFDTYESASSFESDYAVTLANLPDPVNGKLRFVVEKESTKSE